MTCPFQNLSLWPKTPFFPISHVFAPLNDVRALPRRVHCLVLKNNPNHVIFFPRMISNFKYNCPPPPPGKKWVGICLILRQGQATYIIMCKNQFSNFTLNEKHGFNIIVLISTDAFKILRNANNIMNIDYSIVDILPCFEAVVQKLTVGFK